ncbi:MAG: urea ABC transporter permease subunit UrtC [Puniceicoccales bacterium]|jgi:urea transport system permease protein|nr:urea ABC transporter permease subunit UrtC [Puniceicoccales bacterium]
MSATFRKTEIILLGILAFIALVLLPALNAWTPPESFFHISNFTINLYGKYLSYAVLAISVDLLWGFTGLLSLGQCLFFSLGGYAFGMYLALKVGKLGQYKQDLPDFMVFLGYKELPAHWEPFRHFWFAASASALVPALVALAFGYLAFRAKIRGVYFSILTQALTYAGCLMFFQNSFMFGGNNGLTDFKFVLGHDIRNAATQRGLYIATGALLFLTYIFCRWLTQSKFGKIQRAVRDSENRVLFSGYAAPNYKLFVFVIAAAIAGLAGALYVPQVGIINPSEMATDKSLEAIVWVAVGGRGTLVGPVVGAFAVNALKSWATRAFPDLWLIILGGMFTLVVLFMPKGLVGLPGQLYSLWQKISRRRTNAPPDGDTSFPEAPSDHQNPNPES